MANSISIRAPSAVIEELYTSLAAKGVAVDEPQYCVALADAADAAMGTKEIRAALLLLTLAFNTAGAGVLLGEKLVDLKHKLSGTESIELIHPKTGQPFLRIDQHTQDDAIRDSLSAAAL
jgi:hypothetical protein